MGHELISLSICACEGSAHGIGGFFSQQMQSSISSNSSQKNILILSSTKREVVPREKYRIWDLKIWRGEFQENIFVGG